MIFITILSRFAFGKGGGADKLFDRVYFLKYNSSREGSKIEIEKWETTLLDFSSVYKTYEMAMNDLVKDSLNPKGYDNLKSKYLGKVTFFL